MPIEYDPQYLAILKKKLSAKAAQTIQSDKPSADYKDTDAYKRTHRYVLVAQAEVRTFAWQAERAQAAVCPTVTDWPVPACKNN